ncbi:hypothetical protein KQI36_14355 [Clostridium senegalense]|nr:hypothetical protein [Clostridium senegalense]MBU5227815.1 hypothetical protein [Clostridium senegalense]
MQIKFRELRCPWCGALIFRYKLYGSLCIEVKCYKCNGKFSYKEFNKGGI